MSVMVPPKPSSSGLSGVQKLAGYAGFGLSVLLQLLPFWLTNWLMRLVARRTEQKPGHELELSQAQAIAQSVLWASRWWPWRAACLELSRGRFFAAALQGKRLVWHLHAVGDLHAYVTLPDGKPVGEPEFPVWPYGAILSI